MTTAMTGTCLKVSQRPELPSHEVLSQLARDDPEAYEALRRELIEGFIKSAPERLKDRLNGIQFQVDSLRYLSRGSALGATVRIYKLMWESFHSLNHNWQDLVRIRDEYEHRQVPSLAAAWVPVTSARILEFRPRCEARNEGAG